MRQGILIKTKRARKTRPCETVYYLCPKCLQIGSSVTANNWINCCRWRCEARFDVRRHVVTKERYEKFRGEAIWNTPDGKPRSLEEALRLIEERKAAHNVSDLLGRLKQVLDD